MKKLLFSIALILFVSESCKKEDLKSNEAKFLSFSILGEKGIIDETKKEIVLTLVPFTEVNAMFATFQVSTGATVSVGNTIQKNSQTSNNFANPVVFTVQAEDGTKVNYSVIVKIKLNSESILFSFGFRKSVNNSLNVPDDVSAECVKNNALTIYSLAIDLNQPNAVSMIPFFTISKGAKLLINGVELESDKTAYKFASNSTTLTVKAQDGTEQKYTLNLTSQILNLDDFAKKCPTEDVLFSKFTKDFEIRRNGVIVTSYNCSNKSDETMRLLQTLRMLYYVDFYKKQPYLPWSNLRLYDWLKEKVQGFDITDDLGTASGSCCKDINGKKFITLASDKNAPANRVKYSYEDGLSVLFYNQLLLHERRHADGFQHVVCANNEVADADYDEKNLGAYGVGYWFSNAFMVGTIEVGAKCLPADRLEFFNSAFGRQSYAKLTFCKNNPPLQVAAGYKDCGCK